jgi:5'-3' exonuclease
MTILCIDGYNFIHRARGGFKLGDWPVVFNFVRNLRATVEQFNPTRVYFVLEGVPRARKILMPEYKANRVVDYDDKETQAFLRQMHVIIDMIEAYYPMSVVRHPNFEGDDVIYNLIKRSSTAVPWVVVSNDGDFTQLLNEFPQVTVYNPMLKETIVKPNYDYVTWKALRGDGSDNVKGVRGVSDKRAEELASDPEKLKAFLSDPEAALTFQRNYIIIKFHGWSEETMGEMTCSTPVKDWAAVAKTFETMKFQSLLKEATWQKYQATFDPLWG